MMEPEFHTFRPVNQIPIDKQLQAGAHVNGTLRRQSLDGQKR